MRPDGMASPPDHEEPVVEQPPRHDHGDDLTGRAMRLRIRQQELLVIAAWWLCPQCATALSAPAAVITLSGVGVAHARGLAAQFAEMRRTRSLGPARFNQTPSDGKRQIDPRRGALRRMKR
jgi:hypothetical protein